MLSTLSRKNEFLSIAHSVQIAEKFFSDKYLNSLNAKDKEISDIKLERDGYYDRLQELRHELAEKDRQLKEAVVKALQFNNIFCAEQNSVTSELKVKWNEFLEFLTRKN